MPTSSQALVARRYAARAITRSALPIVAPRTRLAYQLARTAFANRHRISQAARTIGKAWKRYKSAKRNVRQVGEPPGRSSSSRDFSSNLQVLDNRTIYDSALIDITRNTTTSEEINNRERDTIVITGIKLCIEIKNLDSFPQWFNVALLTPKDETAGITATGFFRSHGVDRDQNFTTSLPGFQMHCLPVNTDHYVVLRHKRFRLGPAAAFSSGATVSSYTMLDIWLPLKRQIRYDGPLSSDLAKGQVYLVWWASGVSDPSGTAVSVDSYQFAHRAIVYFKNPR